MEELIYQLEQIHGMTGIPILLWERGECLLLAGDEEENPLLPDLDFRKELQEKARQQEMPLIFAEQGKILLGCISKEDRWCFVGPILLSAMSMPQLHQYYKAHGMRTERERPMLQMGFARFLYTFKLIISLCSGKAYEEQQLLHENRLDGLWHETQEGEIVRFQIGHEEEQLFHHTYREEQEILSSVRVGCAEDAVRSSLKLDAMLGRMAINEDQQWRKLVIVSVTLCTRAAIEGGLSPGEAYTLSDFYLQKADECKDIPALIACRGRAITNLCELVQKRRRASRYSSYVERCRDYVEKHYREKIYVDEIAEQMGISSAHLSKLFSKEMGVPLQDFIVRFRIERAANLLIYSEETIGRIAEYVNFPSQSYFGKVFKDYMHVTPREYREAHKPKEFVG